MIIKTWVYYSIIVTHLENLLEGFKRFFNYNLYLCQEHVHCSHAVVEK